MVSYFTEITSRSTYIKFQSKYQWFLITKISQSSNATVVNLTLFHSYLQNHELEQENKQNKGLSSLLRNNSSLYCKIYCSRAIWKEAFDKLINMSFLPMKHFCLSNPSCNTKPCQFLMFMQS